MIDRSGQKHIRKVFSDRSTRKSVSGPVFRVDRPGIASRNASWRDRDALAEVREPPRARVYPLGAPCPYRENIPHILSAIYQSKYTDIRVISHLRVKQLHSCIIVTNSFSDTKFRVILAGQSGGSLRRLRLFLEGEPRQCVWGATGRPAGTTPLFDGMA